MKRRAKVVLTSILLTAIVVALLLNLSLGDKQVDRRIEPLYTVSDPQFARTMGVMLGPAVGSPTGSYV